MSNLVELTGLEIFEGKLKEVELACDFLPDVSTDEGYEKSKRVSLDAGKILTNLEKKRKERKAKHIEKGKAVDIEAKGVRDLLEKAQQPHKDAYKALDTAKKEREENRKVVLENRIKVIDDIPGALLNSNSEIIKKEIDILKNDKCDDFEEYEFLAKKSVEVALEQLTKMFSEKLTSEKEAVELAKLRKEAAELEQKYRDYRIAEEAADKARSDAEAKAKAVQDKVDRERLEAIERSDKAKAKLVAAERQLIASENLAKSIEERRIRTEETNKIALKEAQDKAKQDAIDAAEAAKQTQIKAQADIELAKKREIEAREADKINVGKIRREAKKALMELGATEKLAKEIIIAIDKWQIPHITINY